MEKRVPITRAKDHLSELLEAAERGDLVAITRRGRPIARLVSEREYRRLTRTKSPMDWGEKLVDLSGFNFDREDANARHFR